MAKKVTKKIVFELNYRPENVKEMQNCFYLSWLGSFLVFKIEIRGFGGKFCVILQ